MTPPRNEIYIGQISGTCTFLPDQYYGRQALQFKDDVGVYHPGTRMKIADLAINVSEEFHRDHSMDPLIEWRLLADEMQGRSGMLTLADLGWAHP